MSPKDLSALRQGIRSDLSAVAHPESAAALTETAAELILKSVGEDLSREGLLRTPERFAKAMREVCSGYSLALADVVGQGAFPAEGRGLVAVKDVEFYSMCEHHMLPFLGKISVAYFPGEKILGLSKIPRIVDMFARRFQVQERLTREVAEAIHEVISPRAVIVQATGSHLCMMMRGVEKQASVTTTEFTIGTASLDASERDRLFQSLGKT